MAVTFVKALGSRSETSDAALSQFEYLLPADFASSSAGELMKKLAEIRKEGGSLQTGDFPAGDGSSEEKVLSAFALLLLHRAQDANELLETVEPPESLRLVYWLVKGRAQLEMNEPRKAVASFSMVLRGTDPLASVLFNRGSAYFRMGAFDEADRDFTESLRHRADHVETLVNRHAVRLSTGRKEEALADLNRAIELAPDSARLLLIRSRTLRQLGRLKASKADFDLAMKQVPTSADDWLAVAIARLTTDPAQALRDLQSAENQFGPSTSVLQTMAHVYSEHLQQPEEAIQVLSRLLKAEPGFQKALSGRAVLYARGGKTDLALADIETLEAQGSAVTAESVYQIACAQALCSRDNPVLAQSALSNLAFAVQRNYGVELLLSDPDLEMLRSQPGFDALVQMSRLIRQERTTASQ
jgi:tetratricopeptide (TPR) repeat protein